MIAHVGKRKWRVESFSQVSLAYRQALAAFEAMGGTYPPRCEILGDNGDVVAHVSRTGTVYPGLVMRLGATPLYTP